MIGRVDFTRGDSRLSAVLGDDRVWSCPGDPGLARLLNAAYPCRDDGPALGPAGAAALNAAAAALKGTAVFPPRDPAPPGANH